MVTTRKMEKENNVQGVRRAKAAPDFSKLHKQWDAKLQKGKAVKKKPLTEVQPFQLTESRPPGTKSSSSSCSDDDFITSAAAKEKLFESDNFQNISTHLPKRATIGVVGRSPAVHKSAIPRPSFCVSRRNVNSTILNDKKDKKPIALPTTPKNRLAATPKKTPLNSTKKKETAKKAKDIQGFTVDFKSDAAALDSILNCQGIDQLPKSPSKLSSQFGPSKKTRVNSKQGRVAPFARSSLACRSVKGKVVENEQQNRFSLNAQKQRWSIYTRRDSYTSKPNLMEWLKDLAEQSKAKRLGISKQQIQEKLKSEMNCPTAATSEHTSTRSSFLFRKTLVGYQGDEEKSTNDTSVSAVTSTIIEENEEKKTPEKPLPTSIHDSSTVKSILKKKGVSEKHLSKYSREPTRVGLPFRSLRYESKKDKVVCKGKEEIKSVKWADEKMENQETATTATTPGKNYTPPPVLATPPRSQSPELVPLPTTPSVMNNSRNSSQRQSPVMTRSRAHGKIPKSPLNSHGHQIKYVMPAEQPMEKNITKASLVKSILDETNVPSFSSNLLEITEKSFRPNRVLNAATEIPKEPSTKNWAQVLEEQLDPYAKNLDSTKKTENEVLQNNTDAPFHKAKKKKKRNINRCSILEKIYGKDIYLKDDDDDGIEDDNETNSTKMSTINDSSRPLPNIDDKLVGDLMSFNNDQNDDMELEEPSFFSFSKIIDENEDEKDEEGNQRMNQNNPIFQSTLLGTPTETLLRGTVESIDLTPVLDTSKRLPEAPKRQFTKARTPYKQAMLDILYRTLAEAKKRKGQEGLLDCTVASQVEDLISIGDTTIKDRDDASIIDEKIVQSKSPPNVKIVDQPEEESINLISLSESLQDKTVTPVKHTDEIPYSNYTDVAVGINNSVNSIIEPSITEMSNTEAGPFIKVPNLNSPSMRLFSNSTHAFTTSTITQQRDDTSNRLSKQTVQSQVTYVSPKPASMISNHYLKPASFTINHRTSPRVSEKVFGFSSAVSNTNPVSFPVSSDRFPVPPLFTSTTQNLKEALQSQQGKRRRSAFGSVELPAATFFASQSNSSTGISNPVNIRTAESFPVFPSSSLFSSMSQGVKFSNDRSATLHQQTETTSILRPTRFLSDNPESLSLGYQQQSLSKLNETTFYNESAMFDDSDVCVVIKPPSQNQSVGQNSSLLKPSALSLGARNGAFRQLKPSATTSSMSEQLTPYEISLNTEIEVYTKIGELYKSMIGTEDLEKYRARKDGTFNVVAKLLMNGDSRHFVPIEE